MDRSDSLPIYTSIIVEYRFPTSPFDDAFVAIFIYANDNLSHSLYMYRRYDEVLASGIIDQFVIEITEAITKRIEMRLKGNCQEQL